MDSTLIDLIRAVAGSIQADAPGGFCAQEQSELPAGPGKPAAALHN